MSMQTLNAEMPPVVSNEVIDVPEENVSELEPAGSRRTFYKAVALLLLASLVAYGNSFTKPFHMDDAWITGATKEIKTLEKFLEAFNTRPLIAASIHYHYVITAIFTGDFEVKIDPEGRTVFVYHLDPKDQTVFAYHVMNWMIHLSATLVLFGIVRRTLLLPRWRGRFAESAVWLAFFVALLWMVHPLQTQAVTYIIQRCESLMGLFFLLTLYCTLRGSQSLSQWGPMWYVPAVLLAFLSGLCKEVAITILPVVFGYDYVFLGPVNDLPRRGWRFLPLPVTAFYTVFTLMRRRWSLYLGLAGVALEMAMPQLFPGKLKDHSAGFGIESLNRDEYWMTQCWVLLYYVRLCIIPYPQYFWYREIWTNTTCFEDCWPAALVLGLFLLITFVLVYRRNWLGFLGWWFFGILSITSLVPMSDVAFEHRLYLSVAAPCCLVVIGGYLCLSRFLGKKATAILGTILIVGIAEVLTALTINRNEEYRSNEAIWASWGELRKSTCEPVEMLYVFLPD